MCWYVCLQECGLKMLEKYIFLCFSPIQKNNCVKFKMFILYNFVIKFKESHFYHVNNLVWAKGKACIYDSKWFRHWRFSHLQLHIVHWLSFLAFLTTCLSLRSRLLRSRYQGSVFRGCPVRTAASLPTNLLFITETCAWCQLHSHHKQRLHVCHVQDGASFPEV